MNGRSTDAPMHQGTSRLFTTVTITYVRIRRTYLLLLLAGCCCHRATAAGFSYPPDPAVPADLLAHAAVQPLLAGFVDVTKPPYSAVGDGVHDDGAALQQAIDDAYLARMTVYLPQNKTFLVSQQLAFIQTNVSRAFGFQMVGGGTGADGSKGSPDSSGARPVLRLKDGSSIHGGIFVLFQLTFNPITKKSDSEHYNSRLRNVEIDLGNNPTVSGLTMSGAQLCSIEDVWIHGTSFYAGVVNLPGSGGFTVNLAVSGGEYGVVQDSYRPNPSVSGLILYGQAKAGVMVDFSRGPLVLSGFRIDSGPNAGAHYRAVLLSNRTASKDSSFSGEDGVIILNRSSATLPVAIESYGSDIALSNVYFRGVEQLVRCLGQGVVVNASAKHGSTGWIRVPSYVFTGSSAHVFNAADGGDISKGHTVTSYIAVPGVASNAPPPQPTLPFQHAWEYGTVPTWQSSNLLNIATDYGATPNWVNVLCSDVV
jgi:hypothetical protein